MTKTELQKKRASLIERNHKLLSLINEDEDKRAGRLTDDQIGDEYETNEAEITALDEQIAQHQKWDDRRAKTDRLKSELEASVGLPAPPTAESAGSVTQLTGSDMRLVHTDQRSPSYRQQIQRQHLGNLANIRGVRHGMEPEERAYRLGMWGLYIASMTLPNRYKFKNAIQFVQEQGMIVHGEGAGDSSGAHVTVPSEFSADLINLKEERGVVRQLFNRQVMMRETLTVPRRTGGLTAYAVGENAAGTESDAAFDDIELVARKWMVITRMSKELDEDNAVNLGDTLAGEISYAFADKEDDAGFNGTGTSSYHGILGARTRLQDVDGSGTDSGGLTTQGTGTTWGAIVLGDFTTVVGSLPTFGDTANTVWVCHKTFYHQIMHDLALDSGGTPAMEIREGDRRPRPLFLGYPVVFSQVFPSSTATASVVALLGDFGLSATFGDRRSETIEFDDTVYVNGQSVWERDQIAIKGTERMDIAVHEFGDSTNAGAYVGLETGV